MDEQKIIPHRHEAFLKLADFVWSEVHHSHISINEGMDMLAGLLEESIVATTVSHPPTE